MAALCLVLLAPLTVADVPPLLDYPNHLARLFVLAADGSDPVLARFFQPRWAVIPNLALDLTVPPAIAWLGVHTAGRLAIGIVLLLPVAGAVAYHRVLSGRWSYWPFAAVLFVYNGALLRGFLNFSAATGLALLFAAAWAVWRERWPLLAIAIGALGGAILFFCHLMGLLFFVLLIAGHELAWLWRAKGQFSPQILGARLALNCQVLALPAMLYMRSELGQMPGEPVFRSLPEKLNAALFPVVEYCWALDVATAVLCVAAAGLCLARRWCAVPLAAGAALGALGLLFLAAPHAFKGTFDLDARFIVMAAALAPAALIPVRVPRRVAALLFVGFLVLFGARMGVVLTVWSRWAGDLAAFREVIAFVPEGAIAMTVRTPMTPGPSPKTWLADARTLSDGTATDTHLPALLTIERRAWWPFLFDNPSQQPIAVPPPYNLLAERTDAMSDPIGWLVGGAPDAALYTHLLVLGEISGPALSGLLSGPRKLTRVAGNGTASLFAVAPLATR